MKKTAHNENGFTLAELLIVVAIIGVLVSISIPIFSGQLEKSKEAVDLANMRNAYAVISVDAILGDAATNKHFYYDLSGNLTEGKPEVYGKGTARNGNTVWGGCSDYTYNPEADYTGSVIEVWYDGTSVHVHWDEAPSGSGSGSGTGSGSGAGSGTGTLPGGSGTESGSGTGSGTGTLPGGSGSESGSGTGSETGTVPGGSGTGSGSETAGGTGTVQGGSGTGSPAKPSGSYVLNASTALNYPEKPKENQSLSVFMGERYAHNGKVYIVTTDRQFSSSYYLQPGDQDAKYLFIEPNGTLIHERERDDKHMGQLNAGDIYVTNDGKKYIRKVTASDGEAPTIDHDAGRWLLIKN